MDINKGRIILTHMQICFQDMNLPIMSDKEELNDPFISHHLSFKSWHDLENYHAEILGIVVFEHNIIQLSMNFYSKDIWSKYPSILKMLNLINFARIGYYWQIVPAHKKFEFRTAMIITAAATDRFSLRSIMMLTVSQPILCRVSLCGIRCLISCPRPGRTGSVARAVNSLRSCSTFSSFMPTLAFYGGPGCSKSMLEPLSGNILSQSLQCSVEPALESAFLYAERLGGFGNRQLLHIVQNNRFSQFHGQPANGNFQLLQLLVAADAVMSIPGAFGRVDNLDADDLLVLVFAPVQPRYVGCNPIQPAIQRFAVSQLSYVVPGIEKTLLCQVLADLTIVAEPSHKQIYLPIIPVDKLGGRSTVTGFQSSNQRMPLLIRMHLVLPRMHPIRCKIRRIGLLFRQFCPFPIIFISFFLIFDYVEQLIYIMYIPSERSI